jgi:hypothetical protein
MQNTAPQAKPSSWSIDVFRTFWAKPTAAMAAAGVPKMVTQDIVGYWPRATRPVRGATDYTKYIVDLLTLIPDFRVEVKEHATSGNHVFIRWEARGKGPNGAKFVAYGCDRIVLTPQGQVAENMIMSDHPIFADIARYCGDKDAR